MVVHCEIIKTEIFSTKKIVKKIQLIEKNIR